MISVIVPVYNAERYINRCINSIQNQTYTEWELILIDDGSIDNSFRIIKRYTYIDKRIHVLRQDNAGAGAARNRGLEFVNGEYVVFIDSDDYIEKHYFELLSHHNEDIVFIDVNRRTEKGDIIRKEKLSLLKKKNRDDIIRGHMTGQILWGGVRKAVRADLLRKNDIRYSKHKVGEEAIYSFLLLYYANTISFIEDTVYNYEVHMGSLSQTVQEDPWGTVSIELRKLVKELGCYEEYAETLNCFIYTATIVSLNNLAQKYKYKDYKKYAIQRINNMQDELDKDYLIDKKHMNIKAKILSPLFNARLYLVIYVISKLRSGIL